MKRSDTTVAENAKRRLVSVFADVFSLPLDLVHPGLGPVDVERWDSLGHVSLVIAIEEEFSIKFEVDEIMEFTSFQAILLIIERRMVSLPREARQGTRIGM